MHTSHPFPRSDIVSSQYSLHCLPVITHFLLSGLFSLGLALLHSSVLAILVFPIFMRLTILDMNLNSCMIIIWLSSERICELDIELEV